MWIASFLLYKVIYFTWNKLRIRSNEVAQFTAQVKAIGEGRCRLDPCLGGNCRNRQTEAGFPVINTGGTESCCIVGRNHLFDIQNSDRVQRAGRIGRFQRGGGRRLVVSAIPPWH